MNQGARDLATGLAKIVIDRGLGPRDDAYEAGWQFWERRTLNIHRVVGFWSGGRNFSTAGELEEAVRDVVGRHFKAAWWRGMAYGIVARAAGVAFSGADLESLVDVRDNPRGTLQWMILVDADRAIVLGVHTWIEGYLSPVYRGVLRHLADSGCDVASVARGKDGLMEVLTGVADLHTIVHTLGTKRTHFESFRNEF